MKPTRLSAQVFLELPPVLSLYLEGARNLWLESVPPEGSLSLLNRPGVFQDVESLAVERRQSLEVLGHDRARALRYRMGFEQGRRDAVRHLAVFDDNVRLALQAGPVFGQLQGRYVADMAHFEFDLDARTLLREIRLVHSKEALAHKLVMQDETRPACWGTAGYLSGHVSEILGRRVITVELECEARGDSRCVFVSRLDPEWGPEADWARAALKMCPVDEEIGELRERLEEAERAARRAQSGLSTLNRRLRSDLLLDSMIAQSVVMQSVMTRARQVAAADLAVLIVGEPGTGRQTLARAVHFGGSRKSGPFEVLDSIGLTGQILIQEMIGFVAGAFPGAVQAHQGAAARAHRGVLYVTELAQLDPDAQRALLKVLTEKQVTPLGAAQPVKADVRVIAATQHDPAELVASGRLREDLYYALAVARLDVPPLRERTADVPLLAEVLLRDFGEQYARAGVKLSDDCRQTLLRYTWPGNVRQLRNVLEHAVVFSDGQTISAEDLPEEILVGRWKRAPEDLSEAAVRAALRRSRGNRGQAAELLGVGRTTLWRAMKRMGLQ